MQKACGKAADALFLQFGRNCRAFKFLVAFKMPPVYTGPDESHSSLKGIVRSRSLPMEVQGLSKRATYTCASHIPFHIFCV
jgi:hypothetical protein